MRGVTEKGTPQSFRYSLAEYWVRDFHNLKVTPRGTALLKLKCPIDEEKYHVIYLWWWPGKCCWFIEGTNYSGTGGRNHLTMEKWLEFYKGWVEEHPEYENRIIEAEIPYNAWWAILNGLWNINKQEILEQLKERGINIEDIYI